MTVAVEARGRAGPNVTGLQALQAALLDAGRCTVCWACAVGPPPLLKGGGGDPNPVFIIYWYETGIGGVFDFSRAGMVWWYEKVVWMV